MPVLTDKVLETGQISNSWANLRTSYNAANTAENLSDSILACADDFAPRFWVSLRKIYPVNFQKIGVNFFHALLVGLHCGLAGGQIYTPLGIALCSLITLGPLCTWDPYHPQIFYRGCRIWWILSIVALLWVPWDWRVKPLAKCLYHTIRLM